MKRSRTSEKTKRKAVKAIKLHDYNIAMEIHKYIKKRTLKGTERKTKLCEKNLTEYWLRETNNNNNNHQFFCQKWKWHKRKECRDNERLRVQSWKITKEFIEVATLPLKKSSSCSVIFKKYFQPFVFSVSRSPISLSRLEVSNLFVLGQFLIILYWEMF